MAKKVEPLKEIYAVLNEVEELVSWESTLKLAEGYVKDNEINGAKILKVVQIWEGQYPEEPEIEFSETPLEEM